MTNHYNYTKHIKRQLLVMAAVLLGASLLVMGLVPPQEAQGKEEKTSTQQSTQQQQEQEKAAPAENDEQEEQVYDKDPEGNEYVTGELLVTYKQGASKQAKEEAPKKIGGKVEKDFPEIEVQHVSLPEVKNERAQEARQEALERKKKDLEQHPDVKAVDYNYVREGTMTPNDPDYAKQWAPPKINAPQAWDVYRGSSVMVAVLDSGIDRNHPDLQKVAAQADLVNGDNDATDDVANGGHGTLSAGIVAASMNNGRYGAGTCPNCSLLIVKVLDQNNKGTDTNLIHGINTAVANGSKVINMSLGGFPPTSALETAINNAWNKGIVLVGAAGNKGTSSAEFYPAAYPNVIAVAATDSSDKRAYYEWTSGSYFGPPGKYMGASNAGPWVDVAAPGKGIYTTSTAWNSGCACYISGSVSDAWGTSMAAPHVSGLAGLLFSKGGMSNTQVRKQIEETAKDLGKAGKDDVFGFGRIDALAALSRTYEETDPAIAYSGSWRYYSGYGWYWISDWTSSYLSGASGNYVKYATKEDASATFSFTGNSVTWWATRGSDRNVAYVYVDGSYAGTVDLYSSTTQPRQAVFTKSWSTSGNHTIKIVTVYGIDYSVASAKADVDAFSVM